MKAVPLSAALVGRRFWRCLCLLALIGQIPLSALAASGPWMPVLGRLAAAIPQRLAVAPAQAAEPAFVSVVIAPETLPADGATPGQVLVFVSDADGAPVADGTLVTLSSTLGRLETDILVTREGLAQTALIAPESAGSGEVSARSGSVAGGATFAVKPGLRVGQTDGALPPDALAEAIERARNPLRPQASARWAAANRHYTATVSAQGMQIAVVDDDVATTVTQKAATMTAEKTATDWSLNLQLDRVLVGGQEIYRAKNVMPAVRGNAALYAHTPTLTEHQLARDAGMQQLFTLAAPPDLTGDLVLAVSLNTPLRAELLSAQQGVLFFPPNANPNKDSHTAVLAYSGALAFDAGGRTLYADLTLDKNTLFLRLPEAWLAQADYPVVIDPLIGSPALISDPRPQQDELALAYNPGDDEYLAVWEHFTTGGAGSDLRAQRFQADGTLLGDPISVTVAVGDQLQPSVVFNPTADEYLAVWSDYRADTDGDIYAQRITAAGVLTGSAIAIAATTGLEAEPSVACNPADNLYLVVWSDRPNTVIYVAGQIVGASGVLSGTEIALYDGSGDNQQPRAAYNAANGEFLVVWSRWWQDIYGKRLSAQGVPLDNTGTTADESQSSVAFTVSAAAGHQYRPAVVADPLTGAYLVVWQDNRNESYGDLYGQLVAGNGALSGSEIALSVVSGSMQTEATLTYDAAHQNYLAIWSDMRLANNEDLYAQAITSGGVLSGSAFSVYSATLSQIHPAVVSRPTDGESLVVWNEFGTASRNLYARRLDSAGGLPGTAFPLQVPGDFKQYPAVAYRAGSGYLVVWEDLRHGLNSIYARAYTAQGAPRDGNFALSATPGNALQLHPRVASGENGYLAVWEDQAQDAGGDIYAQRFTAQGVMTGSTFVLAATDERQTAPAVAYNAATDTYLAVWRDMRVDSAGDIYGQILDASGTISGSAFVVSAYPWTSQFAPEVSANPAGAAFLVVWHQYAGSGNYDVYAQQVSGNGVLLDHPGTAADESLPNVSLAVTTDSAYQTLPQVAIDPDGGTALVVWDDRRSGNDDVYGQRLDAGGALTGSNFVIGAAAYLQRAPLATVITGTGDFLVTWDDTRSGLGRGALYGQRVAAGGSLHGANELLGENGNWSLGLALAPAPTLGQALAVFEWGYEIYLQFYNVVGAVFGATPLSGYAPLPVTFSNVSTPAGELTAFDWDFGDGSSSTAISPTHLYSQAGVYTVTLTASGPDGSHSLTRAAYISVTATPTQEVGLQGHWPLDETSGTRYDVSGRDNDLTDNNTVGYATGVISRAADLERNDTESLSIAHSLQQGLAITGSLTLAGWIRPESVSANMSLVSKYAYGTVNHRTYRLELLSSGYLRFAVSPDGAYSESRDAVYGSVAFAAGPWRHVAAVFDAAQQRLTLYCDGTACGTRTLTYNTLYAGTAPFVLGATTYNGAAYYPFDGLMDDWRVYSRALSAAEIQALREPLALFSAAPVTGSAPLSVSFTNYSQGTITTYLWSFGDGITSTLENPTHVYTTPGDYDVSLSVTGPTGSDALALNDYIHVGEAAPDDQPPQADAGPDQNAAEGDLLSFSGAITDTDTPTGHTILWNFGDGSTAFGTLNPTHAYGDNGVFTVTLTVIDTTGLSAADTLVVNVANVAPLVNIRWNHDH